MLTNAHHALKSQTSYNGCETRSHTEFAHSPARSAVSHYASSADHVLLLTINLTLCGHTLYEHMSVVGDPRLTQAGPACMNCLHFKIKVHRAASRKTSSCVPDLNSRKLGPLLLEYVTSKIRGERLMLN